MPAFRTAEASIRSSRQRWRWPCVVESCRRPEAGPGVVRCRNALAEWIGVEEVDARHKAHFLTMNTDPDIASEALRIGASGYLLKTSEEPELLQAVHDAVRGVSYVTPQIGVAIGADLHPRSKRSESTQASERASGGGSADARERPVKRNYVHSPDFS